ncbi:MAG: heparan-alpha-glucosaminide N-acetyltransferase domain-containing protein [Acidimicrobiia bacterium]
MTGAARVRSIDLSRGLVVGLSLFLAGIPAGFTTGYSELHHADWNGVTAMDLVFPSFITLTGSAMAIAAHRFRWSRVLRRTLVLLVLGLGFNALMAWSTSLATLRIPGILQRFALVTLAIALFGRLVGRRWWAYAAAAIVVLGGHGILLASTSGACQDSLPQPGCGISWEVDAAVFGEEHLYRGGQTGHDPEGLVSTLGALGTALLGGAAGLLVLRYRGWRGAAFVTALVVAACASVPMLDGWLPVNKRVWTPSFAVLSGIFALLAVALSAAVYDRDPPVRDPFAWQLEALGRNSLIVYFGKYALGASLGHLAVGGYPGVTEWAYRRLDEVTVYAELSYAALWTLAWCALGALLHWRRIYIRA